MPDIKPLDLAQSDEVNEKGAQENPKVAAENNPCSTCKANGLPPPCQGHGAQSDSGGELKDKDEESEKLQKIAESAHVPAVSYAYVEPNEESKQKFASASLIFGRKNAQSSDEIDKHTRFPASSLSKIVFSYLVIHWADENQISLDESLHDIVKKQIELGKPLDHILKYERFIDNGKYPEKAEQLTIRHILSHTTGLPNVGSDPSSTLLFDANSNLGEKYSYSGEAFLYLQKVIEAITGENLEVLAKKYVFTPLRMDDSTFLPQREDDTKVVALHTELEKPTSISESLSYLRYDLELMSSLPDLSKAEKSKIYLSESPREYYVKGMSKPTSIPPEIDLTNLSIKFNNSSFRSDILAMTAKAGHTPHLNAAGSLLTTADDFSKFIAACLKDPIMQQALESAKCDLFSMSTPNSGEYKNSNLKHLYLYKDEQDQIFYQIEGKKVLLEDNKENQLPESVIKTLKFDQPKNNPVKCHNAETIDKVLAITSKAGHIHFKTCGLGWHLYKNNGEVIAYQYGENFNTRSFVALNVTTKTGAAFFTNSENGMSIANQLFNSPDFVMIGNLQEVYKVLGYIQSDEQGWHETIAGKIAEDQGKFEETRGNSEAAKEKFEEARSYFDKALKLAPDDKSKQLRLEWFNAIHPPTPQKREFKPPMEQLAGKLTNRYEERNLFIRNGSLIHEQFGKEIKLVRISETDFLPETDQSFRISIKGNKVSIHFIDCPDKQFDKHPLRKSQESVSSYAAISGSLGHQPSHKTQTIQSDTPEASSDKIESVAKKPIEKETETHNESIEHEETQYRPK